MKLEHRDIIARAQLHGLLPSEIAGELLEHDLVNLVLDQIPNFKDWSENTQQLTIERVTLGVKDAVHVAIRTIAANGVVTIPVDIKRVQVDAKHMTVTATVDGKDPKKHDLVDHAGHLCLLVMAPDSYDEGLDAIVPDRDQKEFPLHTSDLTGSLFGGKVHQAEEPASQEHPLGTAEELAERTGNAGSNASDPGQPVNKEFGDFDYDDAKQLIVLKANGKPFKAHWAQARLSISSDQATSLLLRLLDDEVIAVDKEGESALDHSYKVIATLEDVVV
ncbi:DNA translocase FtsK [Pseudomonas putida]|nr:DNA translocase FtsK [Pseudomonas putida]